MRAVVSIGVIALVCAATSSAVAQNKPAKLPGDAVAGKATFAARCAMCHGADGQGQAMGPRLKAVFGKKAAGHSDQKYSAALKSSGVQWTAANLDAFLKAPQTVVKGTSMMVAVPGAKDRENLIAYLAAMPK